MNILVVDGNSLGYTSHHAGAKTELANGVQTQAIDGFVRALAFHVWQQPDCLPIVLWDGRAQWRYDMHPPYKSGRQRTSQQRQDRADYLLQVPYLQRLLKHLGVAQLRAPAAEADDLAYWLCTRLSATKCSIELRSSDTDWLQLLKSNVSWKGCRKDSELVSLANFQLYSGYASSRAFLEGKALKGDTADDINGIEGVGDKTAQAILCQYGSFDGFYQAVSEGKVEVRKKVFQALVTPEAQRLWSRNLRLMDLGLAPADAFDGLQWVAGYPNHEGVTRIAGPLKLNTVLMRKDEWLPRFLALEEMKAAVLQQLRLP